MLPEKFQDFQETGPRKHNLIQKTFPLRTINILFTDEDIASDNLERLIALSQKVRIRLCFQSRKTIFLIDDNLHK